MKAVIYYGSEKERCQLRQDLQLTGDKFDVMITTYTVCQRKPDR